MTFSECPLKFLQQILFGSPGTLLRIMNVRRRQGTPFHVAYELGRRLQWLNRQFQHIEADGVYRVLRKHVEELVDQTCKDREAYLSMGDIPKLSCRVKI